MTSTNTPHWSLWIVPLLLGSTFAKQNLASWQGLRGAQIQSRIVLEGGLLTNGTFIDGQWKGNSIVQNSYGVFYLIDLAKSFDAYADDISTYMVPGVPETSNTQAPNYIQGGIFHNDYQFYTWGYVLRPHELNLANRAQWDWRQKANRFNFSLAWKRLSTKRTSYKI